MFSAHPSVWSGVVSGRKPPPGPAFRPQFPSDPTQRPPLTPQLSTQSSGTVSSGGSPMILGTPSPQVFPAFSPPVSPGDVRGGEGFHVSQSQPAFSPVAQDSQAWPALGSSPPDPAYLSPSSEQSEIAACPPVTFTVESDHEEDRGIGTNSTSSDNSVSSSATSTVLLAKEPCEQCTEVRRGRGHLSPQQQHPKTPQRQERGFNEQQRHSGRRSRGTPSPVLEDNHQRRYSAPIHSRSARDWHDARDSSDTDNTERDNRGQRSHRPFISAGDQRSDFSRRSGRSRGRRRSHKFEYEKGGWQNSNYHRSASDRGFVRVSSNEPATYRRTRSDNYESPGWHDTRDTSSPSSSRESPARGRDHRSHYGYQEAFQGGYERPHHSQGTRYTRPYRGGPQVHSRVDDPQVSRQGSRQSHPAGQGGGVQSEAARDAAAPHVGRGRRRHSLVSETGEVCSADTVSPRSRNSLAIYGGNSKWMWKEKREVEGDSNLT